MRHLPRGPVLCAAVLALTACGGDDPEGAAPPEGATDREAAPEDAPPDDAGSEEEPSEAPDDAEDAAGEDDETPAADDAEDAPAQNAGGGEATVTMEAEGSFAFTPEVTTVAVGDTVTWENQNSVPHTVTAEDGTFDSGQLDGGGTFEFTFEEAGTIDYVCEIHPSMTGTVTVEG